MRKNKSRARPFGKKKIFRLLILIILAVTLIWTPLVLEVGGWEGLPVPITSVVGTYSGMIGVAVVGLILAAVVVDNRRIQLAITLILIGGLAVSVASVPFEMLILGLAVVLGLSAIVAVFAYRVFPQLGRKFSGMYLSTLARRNDTVATSIQKIRQRLMEVFNALKSLALMAIRRPLPNLLL